MSEKELHMAMHRLGNFLFVSVKKKGRQFVIIFAVQRNIYNIHYVRFQGEKSPTNRN